MIYIGEYTQKSSILLELLTKDEKNNPVNADLPPTATIEFFDQNGVTVVDRVTLDLIETGRYVKVHPVPEEWRDGDYLVTYQAVLDGVSYSARERFRISSMERTVQDSRDKILELLDDIGRPSLHNTTIYDEILALSGGQNALVIASDRTVLTPTGDCTTVVIGGVPVRGAVVNIWSLDEPQRLVARAVTDENGSWSAQVEPGTYRFEFVVNGQTLRVLERTVN